MVILFFIALFAATPAHATGGQCLELFSVKYGELYPSFTKQHNNKYTVEVSDRNKIKDQCSTSHCHMYAWAAELENAHNITISNEYLDMMHIYEKTVEALTVKNNSKVKNNLAAWSYESREFIQKVGLIPAQAWHGSKDFIDEPMYTHLVDGLEAIVARTLSLRKDKSAEEIEALNAEAISQIQDFIGNIVGQTSMNFEYMGLTYTPVKFAKIFFPELYLPLIDVGVDAQAKKISEEQIEGRLKYTMNHDRAEQLMKDIIDGGRPVYISYNHQDQFIDPTTGIMTISGFAYPPLAQVLSRTQMGDYGKWGGAHAVLIVGYDLDPITHQVIKWKIKNSWGKTAGDKGYQHMYRDFFRMFVWGFSFVDDGKVHIPKK